MTNAKVQHYVPQFLMRNFGNGKKDQVWAYDKSTSRSFPSNTKNLASEGRFYDFEYQGQPLSIEPWLSELEGRTKLVVSTILDAGSLSYLSHEQKVTLASFLAVQLTRTKTFREEWSAFPTLLRDHLKHKGDLIVPGSQAEELLRDIPDSDSKEHTARIVFNAPSIYAAHFLSKDWALAATSRQHPFLLSDNPLTRQNMTERVHRGNLGLTSPGIEIYLPLSPTRALAMWCPTLTDLVHRSAGSLIDGRGADEVADPEGIVAMSETLLSGKPVQYSVANVENFNSLQIAWSERYVFSASNEFNLAQTMLAEHPHLRRGPRSTVA
ncbi:DUF4238 domain-containing protein [Pseudomonas sp. N40(2020)]|uniref:DUF4238 domain-containing protein n=1 Tax=Pseudomonas sp. N40(2020) TaxID=2767798 RepID=UPI0016574FFF|nr:DUF4238 domain-containing protein [Pseudomonas sp. N40(2020)]MBC9000214.1 DUF4238 domain-containing protein [Pseudomonas sp. N40(2020)]